MDLTHLTANEIKVIVANLLDGVGDDKTFVRCGHKVFLLTLKIGEFRKRSEEFILYGNYRPKKSQRAVYREVVEQIIAGEEFYLNSRDGCVKGRLLEHVGERTLKRFKHRSNIYIFSANEMLLKIDPDFQNRKDIELWPGTPQTVAFFTMHNHKVLVSMHAFDQFCTRFQRQQGRKYTQAILLNKLNEKLKLSVVLERKNRLKQTIKHHFEPAVYRYHAEWLLVTVWEPNLQCWCLRTSYEKKGNLDVYGLKVKNLNPDQLIESWKSPLELFESTRVD